MPERFKVVYDIDDNMLIFNEAFLPFQTDENDVFLGEEGNFNSFDYKERYPRAFYIDTKDPVLWVPDINTFSLNHSVERLHPKPGVLEHLEQFAPVIYPVAMTSRPAHHRKVTEDSLKKHFGDYFTNMEEQLFMPDEERDRGIKPHKIDLAKRIGAVAVIDDAPHNLVMSSDRFTTSADVKPILYTDAVTTWNHNATTEGIERAVGWDNVSRILGRVIRGLEVEI